MAFKDKQKRKPRKSSALAKPGSEDAEQIALIDWVTFFPEISTYFFCIPNQRQASAYYGYKLKRMGGKAGVSDLFLARPNGLYCGLWIELKRVGGVLSAPQKRWIELMNLIGYKAIVAYGWEAARDAIVSYMSEK